METSQEQLFWTTRYMEGKTGWDIGEPSTPLKTYIDQLERKDLYILIPGAGNAYEAEYLIKKGFTNVFILDISEIPLTKFKERNPDFPEKRLFHQNFFDHCGQYDLILEQTFFCSFVPSDENRYAYAKHMSKLLKPQGKLVGLWFDFPLTDDWENRPFGGDKLSYINYFSPYLDVVTFENCHNSIKPRKGRELFGIFRLRKPM